MKSKFDIATNRHPSPFLQFRSWKFDLSEQWKVLSLEKLCAEHARMEMERVTSDEKYFFALAHKKGYNTENATWEQLFDQIFLNEIEPHLPTQPCFLVDFPARLSPLCKVNQQKPYLAERFEALMGGIEIGNGNNENTDAVYVRKLMEAELAHRRKFNLPTYPIDQDFIAALQTMNKSGKHFAGVGLGVDRLLMILENRNSIRLSR